jgi:regulator of sigma E protease
MTDIFFTVLLILVVIAMFNVMIFVHELGHFLAARWRGLQVDRFQIWFGKPIWKKTINGVQYGLGWIPAGGFVALPQMAAMESIEGDNLDGKPLPPVTPLDKIIVAVAGPLFSLLLAVVAALAVWGLGKPQDAIKSNVVGGLVAESPANGVLEPGDEILEVDGKPVQWFAGRVFDDITTRVMLTEGDDVTFTVVRDGETREVTTKFMIRDTPFYKRRALPQIGMAPSTPAVVLKFSDSKTPGPAERAGMKIGDEIIAVNGEKIFSPTHVSMILRKNDWQEATFTVKRGEQTQDLKMTPLKPLSDFYEHPLIGIMWDPTTGFSTEILHPNPWEQISESLRMMAMTIKTISSPTSNVGVDQLAGPIGIARTKFLLLQQKDGWLRVLAFFVLFNVNLAVLNMMPLPVLDGGHIMMAIYEWIRGRPLPQRFLEIVQTAFALLLMGFMLFITTKDIGDEVPDAEEEGDRTIEWPKLAQESNLPAPVDSD